MSSSSRSRSRPPLDAHPQAIPLTVVYEDDALLVVDKPAGMVTHPAHGARDGTLVNALLAHAGTLPGDRLRAGLVHRLDRDSSGLLVVAKTDAALRALGKAMMARTIERTYRGLVVGVPHHRHGTIEGAFGRDPRDRLRYAIRSDGKPAVTHYEVREALQGASELEFRLETGRTHQIRVHVAALGHPLLNDPVYGTADPRVDLPGQALARMAPALSSPAHGRGPGVRSAAAGRLRRSTRDAARTRRGDNAGHPAFVSEPSRTFTLHDGRRGAARDALARARGGRNAGLHAGRNGGQRQRAHAGRLTRARCARRARQYVSSVASSRRRDARSARRPARVHAVGTATFSPTAAVSKYFRSNRGASSGTAAFASAPTSTEAATSSRPRTSSRFKKRWESTSRWRSTFA